MDSVPEPYVIAPGAGRLLDMGTFQAQVLAAGDQTDQEFSLLLTQSEPAGFGPPLHRHHDAAEAFFVLEGDYLMFLGEPGAEEQTLCPPGTFVYVPRGHPHTFQVVSEAPGRKLNIFAPAGMVGFFEALAEAEAAGTATPELLDRIAAAHQMEVLGPVPESYL